jgi:hypothetical protein
MRLQSRVETNFQGMKASLLINKENRTLANLAAKPGFTHGNANGEVDGEKSLFRAGSTDEHGDGGEWKETVDAPFEGWRRA